MWHLLEPLHAVLYHAPQAFEEAAALGYPTGQRWPSYFPYRAAPLGHATPTQVTAAFYSFAPHTVEQHLTHAWHTAHPHDVLKARERAIDRTYRTLLGNRVTSPELIEAAHLARRAAQAAPLAGRTLAAAHAALPWPTAPHLQLWHAATLLREHRGDGHITALLTADLDPVEALVSFAAIGAAPEPAFAGRGWTQEEWTAARTRLTDRGLIDPTGTATDAGHVLRARIETHTDHLAHGPWHTLGATDTARLADLLGEFWLRILSSGLLPADNTLGIGRV
ncbi:hypothetical protein [Streptomyces sp. NPDC058045]|uniref:SCO6745 family protein n=1 Tax=Streptomyces sp. NPDC058045 TaxID=3346311 RepID=UPI0036F0DC4C